MPRYNCSNTDDRYRLASEVLKLLVASGFKITNNTVYSRRNWKEFIAEKNLSVEEKIIVYTTIEKCTGLMYDKEKPAITVVRRNELDNKPHFRRVARIKKDSTIDTIILRIKEAIKKAAKQLNC